jgi:hypothetical protein
LIRTFADQENSILSRQPLGANINSLSSDTLKSVAAMNLVSANLLNGIECGEYQASFRLRLGT